MLRLFKSILVINLLILLLPLMSVEKVGAVDEYALACSTDFELDYINDQGGFNMDSCYSTFEEAKIALDSKPDDYVIRHHQSLSPTKIIAINSGIAYSYPKRSDKYTTLNITQNYEEHKYRKSTYVVQHRELNKPETINYNNGSGRVNVNLLGFDGFVDLKDIDLVPTKFITNNLPIYLGGNTVDNSEEPFKIIPKQAYYTVEQNGNYKDLVYHYFSGWAENVDPVEYKTSVGPANDQMNVGDKYYSYDQVNYYSDYNYQNFLFEYYNYYQFLPTRTKTNIDPATYDLFLNSLGFTTKPTSTNIYELKRNESQLVNEGHTFIENQNIYGVNASLVFSLACLESGYGRSQFAVDRNNFFGWGAIDSEPGQAASYPTVADGIRDHMALNLRNYLDVNNGVFFGMHFGNKGSGFNVKYASDPYWGTKVAGIYYELDKLDNGYSGALTDYNNYSIGLIKEYKTPIYRNDDGKNVFFTSEYGATYQNNFTIPMLENGINYTKVQIPNIVVDNELVVSEPRRGNKYPITPYDFNVSVGYIKNDGIRLITGKKLAEPEGTYPEGDFVSSTTKVELIDNMLMVEGSAYQPGIYLENQNDLTFSLQVIDKDQNIETYPMNVLFNGPEHYKYSGFTGYIGDITKFKEGIYDINVLVKHEKYENSVDLTLDKELMYSFYGYDYIIKNIDGKLKLIVQERILDIDHFYATLLKDIHINSDNKLELSGFALVEGYNNSKENVIHELELADVNTKEVYKTILLDSYTGDYDLSDAYNHKLDYSYAWFKGIIDLNDIDYGDYELRIKTTIKDQSYTKKLTGQYDTNNSYFAKINDNKYASIYKQYMLRDRIDLSIKNYQISKPSAKLPSIKDPYSYYSKIKYNDETNHLIVKGSSFIWNVNHDSQANVIYRLYFANKTTGEVFSFDTIALNALNDGDFSWDNTVEFNSEYDYSNTWFEFDIDLSNFSDGDYDLYLQINTNEYVALIDGCSSIAIDFPNYQTENKTLIMKANFNNRGKLDLTIKGFK